MIIGWIKEYKKVIDVNDKITKLHLDKHPICIVMYIKCPRNILNILPKSVHQKTTQFTIHDNNVNCKIMKMILMALYYCLFNSRCRRDKSAFVNVAEMKTIMWQLYYHNDFENS